MTTLEKSDQMGQATHPLGTGFRPAFHALWHLLDLKVASELTNFQSEAWDRAQKGDAARIAIIDTPIDPTHPNLQGAIEQGWMRDFCTSPTGVFTAETIDEDIKKARDDLEGKIKADISAVAAAVLNDIKSTVSGAKSPHGESKPGHMYGAHGTSVAGLIGARPAKLDKKFLEPAYRGDDQERDANEVDLDLPYAGINPFCRIIPIAVSAAPNVEMLIGAVQYARLCDPDIVVIADSWDRPKNAKDDERWITLQNEFLGLCRTSIVFCAAGNEALSTLVYPASLSDHEFGPWAVGACDSNGGDLTYSPNQKAILGHGRWMIKTLSTEHSRYDRDVEKIDPWEDEDEDVNRPPGSPGFPPTDIVATDLPGRAGYNPSPYDHMPGIDGLHYEIASLYCRFSGTSAATAIAAGLVSLIPGSARVNFIRNGKKPSEGEVGEKLSRLFDWDTAKYFFEESRKSQEPKHRAPRKGRDELHN